MTGHVCPSPAPPPPPPERIELMKLALQTVEVVTRAHIDVGTPVAGESSMQTYTNPLAWLPASRPTAEAALNFLRREFARGVDESPRVLIASPAIKKDGKP